MLSAKTSMVAWLPSRRKGAVVAEPAAGQRRREELVLLGGVQPPVEVPVVVAGRAGVERQRPGGHVVADERAAVEQQLAPLRRRRARRLADHQRRLDARRISAERHERQRVAQPIGGHEAIVRQRLDGRGVRADWNDERGRHARLRRRAPGAGCRCRPRRPPGRPPAFIAVASSSITGSGRSPRLTNGRRPGPGSSSGARRRRARRARPAE